MWKKEKGKDSVCSRNYEAGEYFNNVSPVGKYHTRGILSYIFLIGINLINCVMFHKFNTCNGIEDISIHYQLDINTLFFHTKKQT